MKRLRARAPGKVNLSLLVGAVRDDGRHELVTVLESVSLHDELELTVLGDDAGADDEVVCPGVEGPNLVTAALEGLRARGWDGPRVRIEIVKRIPVAGGMAGGSSDAAAALRLAEAVHPVTDEVIAVVAAEVGSDVPSQLVPGAWIATGAGDSVEAAEPLESHAFVVVPQSFELSTADVYREADRLGDQRSDAELSSSLEAVRTVLSLPGGRIPAELAVNDLEPAALSLRPEIASVLDRVRAAGAESAFVSGSGPTVVGLLWGENASARADAVAAELSGRYPGACAAVAVGEGFGQPSPSSGTIR
ncbi:MAG: 4-(cytidine 5'-diphospho)-2-C-methyl-D-erythritol kinase [Solirubrobacteraceae bacterium]